MNVIARGAWSGYAAGRRAGARRRSEWCAMSFSRPARVIIFILICVPIAVCGGGSTAPTPTAGPAPTPAADGAIGTTGGNVSLLGGTVRLAIPAGALTSTLTFSARASTAPPLDPWSVGGSIVEIQPSGTTFASPASLTLRYQGNLRPSGTAPQDLRVHRFNGSSWQSLGGTNDVAGLEATAPITGAGIYSVRWTGPTGPCVLPEDRQFDFWLGEWNLNEITAGGDVFHGTNNITRDDTGCVLDEDYRSGGQGRSVSLYSRIDGRWHQTYTDSMGNRLILIGAFDGGRMLLTAGATRSFWQPVDRNTVRFVQEQSRDGGQTWTPFFDSRYTRR